jgi:YidC/Oxa1 family membrane protein insertase
MDRNTIIGFVLIGIVLMVWMWLNAPPPQTPMTNADSTALHKAHADTTKLPLPQEEKSSPLQDTLGTFFSKLTTGEKKTIVIETPKYRAEIGTEGGAIQSWLLTQYKTWNNYPINLINGDSTKEFNLQFVTSEGKFVNTKHLFFHSNIQNGQVFRVAEGDSVKIDLTLSISEKSQITKSFTFYGNTYSFDVAYGFVKMEDIISNYEYQVTWENGLRYVEHNSINECNFAKASGLSGGELSEVDATNFTDVVKQKIGRASCRERVLEAV